MEIGIGITRQIIINGEIDTLDVDSTAENIGSNTYTLVEFLEFLIAFDTISVRSQALIINQNLLHVPFLLAHTWMHCNAWEVAFSKEFI